MGAGPRRRDLLGRRVSRILLVGVALAVLQQWSGINSIFNYAEEIYRSAGYGISDIMFNIVMTGSINLVFTLVAMATVDRIGRRTLMLVGCAGIGLSHVLLGGAYAMHWTGTAVLAFTLCSLLLGFTTSGAALIVLRALEGLGAAFMSPAALSSRPGQPIACRSTAP